MKIMPALLDQKAEEIRKQIEALSPYFKSFQIDIGDGIFVPNNTVQLRELAWVLKEFPEIVIDFHLMVHDWEKDLETIDAIEGTNIRYVLIHSKTAPRPEAFKEPRRYKLGMVLNPDEDVKTIKTKYDLSAIPSIQIMTVNPGFQGQSFIEDSLDKIEQLRDAGYESDIFIDGSVNLKTIPVILSRKFQPDYAGIGSFLTKSQDLPQAIRDLDAIEGIERV